MAWANAPMQTVSVEKALPAGSDMSAQVLSANAFYPERNQRKSRLKITQAHKAHKEMRKSAALVNSG